MSISIKLRPILWASLVTVLLHQALSSSMIEADISAQVVRVGDNVTFTCKLTELGSNTVTLNKVVTKPEGQFLVEQISINDELSRVYTNIKRFSVVRTTEGGADVFRLRITGVQLEDSGNYGCDVKSDNLFSLKVLEVYRKPENVSLYLDNKLIGNGSVITVREIQNPLNLVCRVSDVMPQPSVEILLELGMVATMNVTKDFVVVPHTNAYCVESTTNKACPLHLSYSIEATNRDFNVSFLHDSQKLRCISNISGFEKEQVATEVTLQVLLNPIVDGAEGVLKRGIMLPVVVLALFTIFLFRQL